jgi:hypothetical protein
VDGDQDIRVKCRDRLRVAHLGDRTEQRKVDDDSGSPHFVQQLSHEFHAALMQCAGPMSKGIVAGSGQWICEGPPQRT